MGSFSYNKSKSEYEDPGMWYRMPAWNEAMSQMQKYIGGGMPKFDIPQGEELNQLFAMSPTEMGAQVGVRQLAGQGYTTPFEQAAGMTSMKNLFAPEWAMQGGLTDARNASLFGTPGTAVSTPGSIESMYTNLFNQAPGKNPYMEKMTGGAWEALTKQGMDQSQLVSDLLQSQGKYQDQAQMAQIAPQVMGLQGAGLGGLERSIGPGAKMQTMGAAEQLMQMPYQLQMAKYMLPGQMGQQQFGLENSLWQLAQQMMGAAPAGRKDESLTIGGGIGKSS